MKNEMVQKFAIFKKREMRKREEIFSKKIDNLSFPFFFALEHLQKCSLILVDSWYSKSFEQFPYFPILVPNFPYLTIAA